MVTAIWHRGAIEVSVLDRASVGKDKVDTVGRLTFEGLLEHTPQA